MPAGRVRSESVSVNQLGNDGVTSAPISRTQSLPTARFRGNSAMPSANISQDDSSYRRKSWFRNLGHKLGFEKERNPGMASSPQPTKAPKAQGTSASPPGSPHPEAMLNFKNPFDTSSQPLSVPMSAESSTTSFKERLKRLSKGSIEGGRDRRTSTSSEASAIMPDRRVSTSKHAPTGGSPCAIPELARYMTKRVAFAPEVFAHDPPQIIPPLHPQPGNVEFTYDGKLKVTPCEKFRELGLSRYLESNHNEIAVRATVQAAENASRLHQQLTGKIRGGFFSKMAGDHPSIHNAEENDWEKELLDSTAICTVPVDGARANWGSGESESASETVQESDRDAAERAKVDADLSPERVYTRCCHLREIMPIKSMLRQLKGAKAPITILRIGNTKPTMIEILAFSDFLTVMPVLCVNLHNLVLTAEMLRLILHGLERSTKLGRLSLKNTKLDDEGWKYLCAFLLRRNSLSGLGLEVDFSKKLSVPEFDRRNMDWKLLNSVLATNGVDILDLEGTRLPDEDLELLLREGFRNGRLLGVARNNVSHEAMLAIQDWFSAAGSRADGLHLQHNDLSKEWQIVQDLLYNPQIMALDLCDTNLHRSNDINPFLSSLISPRLEVLDLSDNPQLFPVDLPRLVEALPAFRNLSRLSLNGCGITSDMMVMLCEAISHCHKLVYLSLKNNGTWTETSRAALCVTVRMGRSLCTVEADFDDWAEPDKARITKYCIENLEHRTSGQSLDNTDERDMEEFKRDLNVLSKQLNDTNQPAIDKKTVDQVIKLRSKVRERLGQLLEKKSFGQLSSYDREQLISMWYYDGSLDRLIKQCATYSDLPRDEESKKDAGADETVSNVNEFKPSLSRRSSHSSLISLKKQEHEEGEFHKINTFLAQNPQLLTEEVPELTGEMLRQALLEKSGSTETVISQLRQLHAADLEKILN